MVVLVVVVVMMMMMAGGEWLWEEYLSFPALLHVNRTVKHCPKKKDAKADCAVIPRDELVSEPRQLKRVSSELSKEITFCPPV